MVEVVLNFFMQLLDLFKQFMALFTPSEDNGAEDNEEAENKD